MSLYNCKSTSQHEIFRITKFNELGEEKSYLVGQKTCECEGFVKHGRCRHLQMRIMFMTKHHVDDGWFLDFDSRNWKEFSEVFSKQSSDVIIEQVTSKADDLELGATVQAPNAGVELVSPTPPPEVEQLPPSAPSGVSLNSASYPPNDPRHADPNDLWIDLP